MTRKHNDTSPHIDRRAVLAATAGVISLAGCSSGGSDDETAEGTTTADDGSPSGENTTTTTSATESEDWPTFRQNQRNTGFNRGTTGPSEEPTERWQGSAHDEAHPAVVGDTVYIGGSDTVSALDAASGETLWTYEVGAQVDAAPAVADGTVVFNDWDGAIHAVSTDDASEKWTRTTSEVSGEGFDWSGNALQTGAVTVVDGIVYKAGRVDRKDAFWALDLATGETEFVIDATPENDDNAWPTSPPGADGRELFTSAPAVADGMAYLASETSGYHYGIDLSAGEVSWARQPAAGREEYKGQGARGSQSVANGTMVSATSGRGDAPAILYGLDATTGETLWHYQILEGEAEDVRASTAIAHGAVVIGDTNGGVHAVELADGTERWTIDVGSPVYVGASADSDRIYVADYGATVYALDPASGEIVWEYDEIPGRGDVDIPPVVADDRLFVNARGSPLIALDGG